jgi:hypothetical protein
MRRRKDGTLTMPPLLKRRISFVNDSWNRAEPCSSIKRPAPPTWAKYRLPTRGPANAYNSMSVI